MNKFDIDGFSIQAPKQTKMATVLRIRASIPADLLVYFIAERIRAGDFWNEALPFRINGHKIEAKTQKADVGEGIAGLALFGAGSCL
ncbi:MAG: hypothetical protein KDN20_00810 [Verrucomicrobiae bacterium]|nr:hypothetical protein [Verrucomicrobiae bacterium]